MLSEKPWKGEAVFRLVLGLFVAFGVGGLAVQLVEKFGGNLPSNDRQFLETIILTLSFQGLGLLLVGLFLYQENVSWSIAFGFKRVGASRTMLLGIVCGILVLPFAWGLQQLSVWMFNYFQVESAPQEIIQKLQSGKEPPTHQTYLFVVAVLFAPVIEEILFRGILYPTVKQLGFRRLAMWGTAAVFALTHFNKQTFLPLLFFAVVLTLLYEETDNLLGPIFAHSAFNAANFVLLLYRNEVSRFLNL